MLDSGMKLILRLAILGTAFVGAALLWDVTFIGVPDGASQLAIIYAGALVLGLSIVSFLYEGSPSFSCVFVAQFVEVGSVSGTIYFESFWPIAIGLLILGVWLVLIWIKEGKIQPTEVM